MKVLWWIPKILIVAGVIGSLVAGYKRDRLTRALVVLKWCELDTLLAKPANGALANTPACDAARRSTNDNLGPLLRFYKDHPNYDAPEGQ